MKFLPALLALGAFARIAFADDAPIEAGLLELHGEHVGLVEGTASADGRYAAGWTVHPKKGKPPVKWAQYGKEGSSFFEDYFDNEGYVVEDVIVDLSRHAIVATLQFKEPYFNGKNHGSLQVIFGPESDGHRYAIALSDSKWEPNDVVLVDLAAEGATQADVRKTLDAAVLKYIRGKRSPKGYTTDYQLFSLPELGVLTGFADATTMRVPFSSCIPKEEDVPNYAGTVLLRFATDKGHPHAEAGEVRENDGNPNPTADDPRIVAADKELNAAYAALRTKLDAASKTKLVAEQRAWIKERDEKIANLGAANTDKTFVNNPRIAADRLLLKLTQERTAALRAR